MNQTDVLIKMVELAKVGGAMQPDEAMAHLAKMATKLDVCSDSYEADLTVLVEIGATIWDLRSGPKGAYDPSWIPPFLRP